MGWNEVPCKQGLRLWLNASMCGTGTNSARSESWRGKKDYFGSKDRCDVGWLIEMNAWKKEGSEKIRLFKQDEEW